MRKEAGGRGPGIEDGKVRSWAEGRPNSGTSDLCSCEGRGTGAATTPAKGAHRAEKEGCSKNLYHKSIYIGIPSIAVDYWISGRI